MSRRTFKVTTSDVFKAIDGERNYQESRWNPETTTTNGIHTVHEWLDYIVDYAQEAKHWLTREAKQHSDPKALENVRKIAAMAVCCMEQNGAPQRKGFEQ